jgi:peptide/nickel transport system permease protein
LAARKAAEVGAAAAAFAIRVRSMWAFTLRRLLYAVPVLLGVSMLVFVLIHLAPGDVVDILVPPEVPKEIADGLRRRFRLDEPIYLQYLAWLSRLMVGDFGISFFTGRPVAEELFGALGNTLIIALPAALLGFSLGIMLGALAAYSRDSWLDKVFSATAIVGVSLPHYWVGIVLVAIFSVVLNMLPAQGMGFEGVPSGWNEIKHLILPVITLSLIPMGVTSRLVRANVLEILSQEFVGTLHAKGLSKRRVLYHTLKNAAPSALALMGLQFGYLLGGSILVETVFNWPGSGGLMNLAIFRRDVPVLSATILVLAAIFVVINILVDVLQALIDPRMRR